MTSDSLAAEATTRGGRPRTRRSFAAGDPLAGLGRAAWRTLTSVRFAVLQITVLVVAGLIGTMVRQMPAFALRDPSAYAKELADLHRRFDGVNLLGLSIGPGMVELFDRLGFFRVFSAPWFLVMMTLLVVSIIVCTLDRTPRLWRGVRLVRPVQPPEFFDLRLPERARFDGAALGTGELRGVLRSRHYKVRENPDPDDTRLRHVYGDRNQYLKMATLFTHLGLILFLVGGVVTSAFGYETVLFVGNGATAPVQPVGTPHNLLVKNLGFEAPRRANGSFEDFRTTLAVFQDGREIARKTIRVNDPLSVANFVFHQNTFGPAADLEILDPEGRLVWSGPLLLTGALAGQPQGFMTIPGSNIGLLAVLARPGDGGVRLAISGLVAAANGDNDIVFLGLMGLGSTTDPAKTAGYTITWRNADSFTGMVVKNDPGQGLIWVAYGSLILGLLLSFYFPRRRVWARVSEGRVELAMLADRYVDAEKEFGALLADIGARTGRHAERRPG
ncbi:MAG: cytochrome c biogenesis protein ResB [Chloroflexi bacterium]|nr:cytochrome c biogenesis protein ResB [Chloroflexota bacterium]